jgi:hypothetical protein
VSVALRAWGGALIQVDDCSPELAERLRPFAFAVIETSPDNFQVWIALAPETGEARRKAVRDRLLRKFKESGETANGGAYNAVRLPGSLNCKQKYLDALGEFPRVRLSHVAEGRTVTPEELEAAGWLAAPPAPVEPGKVLRFTTSKLPAGRMPDLNDYLARKWKADENRPDRSSAEMAWACACLRKGFPDYAVEDELRRITLKGRGRSDNYESKTVENAARFLASQPDTSRGARERIAL